jgi:RNA polymerase subunit RPABC4/transcription elongation factor Spt4
MNGEARGMKCPNCDRVIGSLTLRCRVCHQRLALWYVFIVIIAVATLSGLILLLDKI